MHNDNNDDNRDNNNSIDNVVGVIATTKYKLVMFNNHPTKIGNHKNCQALRGFAKEYSGSLEGC